MSWSPAFQQVALGTTRAPVYLLDTILPLGSTSAQLHLSSHGRAGYVEALRPLECSVSWGAMSVPGWSTSGSSMRIVVDPEKVSLEGVERGVIMQLSVALGGLVEPVYTGVLNNVSGGFREPMVLELIGLEAALWSKYEQPPGQQRDPFQSVGEVGAVTFDYSPGDANFITSLTTLDKGFSGKYCVKVTPASGTVFYITGTSFSAGTLSGSLSAALDTTLATALIGAEVVGIAYDEGHPIDLVSYALDWGAILTWPDEWRVGLPQNVYDRGESNQQAALELDPAVATCYRLVVEAAPQRFADILHPLANDGGCVIVQHQGQVAARLIQAPAAYMATAPLVRDTDVIDASWRAWHDEVTPEVFTIRDRSAREPVPVPTDDPSTPAGALAIAYRLVGMQMPPLSGAGSSVWNASNGGWKGTPATLVVEQRTPIFGGTSDRTDARQSISNRLRDWVLKSPESIRVTLPGWRPESIGDAIRLQGQRFESRLGTHASSNFRGQPCLIVGGGPDLFGCTTTYDLIAVPDDEPPT